MWTRTKFFLFKYLNLFPAKEYSSTASTFLYKFFIVDGIDAIQENYSVISTNSFINKMGIKI